MFILVHGLRGFNPWFFSPVDCVPVVAQYIMVEACGRGKLLTSWQPESEEGVDS
jgi:hypothetical protein